VNASGSRAGPLRPVLRWLASAAVAAFGLLLAFRLALPEGEASIAASLADAWRVPLAEGTLWFALAWGILGSGLLVGATRFHGLLRAAGLEVAIARLFRGYLVASFFNFVLPGVILGDVYRFWDTRLDTGRGSQVLGIVALERLMGLAALGAIALLVAPLIPLPEDDHRLLWLLVATGASFMALSGAVLLPPVGRGLRGLARRISHFSPALASYGDRALSAVADIAARPAAVMRAFGLSLVSHGVLVSAVAVLALPLDATLSWYWFAVIVPFITLITLIPVSLGGAGVRELLYVTLFGAVGMRPEAALALSLSVTAAALLWALLGLVLFVIGRRRLPSTTSQEKSS
jgi:uncharacterized membrane protein YbhN (UPF0104 family)